MWRTFLCSPLTHLYIEAQLEAVDGLITAMDLMQTAEVWVAVYIYFFSDVYIIRILHTYINIFLNNSHTSRWAKQNKQHHFLAAAAITQAACNH